MLLRSGKSLISDVLSPVQIFFVRESTVSAAKSTTSPFDCIAHYEELQKFVASVSDVCSQAQDAAGQQKLHIVTALESIRDNTWTDVKSAFTSYEFPTYIWLIS